MLIGPVLGALAAAVLVPVAASGPALGRTAPRAVSATATPAQVTYQYGKDTSVKVSAVFDDPAGEISHVEVWDDSSRGMSKREIAREGARQGERRSFAVQLTEYTGLRPGKRTVQLRAFDRSYREVARATTTHVVYQKPILSLHLNGSSSAMWGKKGYLYGGLGGTSVAAARRVVIQFKAKGAKKWATRYKLRTDDRGEFQTKKFRVNQAGVWRAKVKKKGYSLAPKPAKMKIVRY